MTGFVLDDTILDAFGHGSSPVAHLLAGLDAREVRIAVPATTLAYAQAALSEEQCDEINGVVDGLAHLRIATLHTADECTEFSRVIGVLGEPADSAAAHAVYVSAVLDWPIITCDPARWKHARSRLPWVLELIELAEPEAVEQLSSDD